SAWRASRGGIAERWGYRAGGRGWMLTRGVRRPRGRVHHTEYYQSLVRGLGIDPAVPPEGGSDERVGRDTKGIARLAARPQPLEKAAARLRERGAPPGATLVGFAPGAAYGHAKRWPPERVAAVIVRLRQRGATAVLVGAAADRDTARAIESSLPA